LNRSSISALLLLVAAGCGLFSRSAEVAELAMQGETRQLRDDPQPRSAATERRSDLLIIALDGVDRDLLYRMLRAGELPGLASLIGGRAGGFPHAHFDRRVLSCLPSNTFPAWASLFTGQPPAVHGVPSNEFFLREKRELAAPGPTSFKDSKPSMLSYTGDYADQLLQAPTIYQQIRRRDPGVRIWVSMSHFHGGADRLLTANQSVLLSAFRVFLDDAVSDEDDDDRLELYAELDEEVLDTLRGELDGVDRDQPLPDVITVYLSGTDLFAHVAEMGPDRARRTYLTKVVDPNLRKLRAALAARGGLDGRYVVVVSDHGHTAVLHDREHALGSGDDPPARVLEAAGFRVRPFEWKVDKGDDYQAVIAYGGAFAFVYLADRSTCAAEAEACDFRRPARYRTDVLAAAEAFHQSARTGAPVAAMRDSLDLVLVRSGADGPFRVYLGDGKTEDIDRYLAQAPRDGYVQVAERMRELAVGRHGDRAGDVILVTRGGGEANIRDRYYFSQRYRSWHGSPSRRDSEVPFILAHAGKSRRELGRLAYRASGASGRLHQVGRLLVDLRLAH
jgi:hypothetical protein